MSRSSQTLKKDRRSFLKGVAAAGGVATVAVASGAAIADVDQDTADGAPQTSSRGYHLTPHIAEYYKKARF